MAREAIVRPDKAQRSEDTGTKYPAELQRRMSERGRASKRTFMPGRAAGARYFEPPFYQFQPLPAGGAPLEHLLSQ